MWSFDFFSLFLFFPFGADKKREGRAFSFYYIIYNRERKRESQYNHNHNIKEGGGRKERKG